MSLRPCDGAPSRQFCTFAHVSCCCYGCNADSATKRFSLSKMFNNSYASRICVRMQCDNEYMNIKFHQKYCRRHCRDECERTNVECVWALVRDASVSTESFGYLITRRSSWKLVCLTQLLDPDTYRLWIVIVLFCSSVNCQSSAHTHRAFAARTIWCL